MFSLSCMRKKFGVLTTHGGVASHTLIMLGNYKSLKRSGETLIFILLLLPLHFLSAQILFGGVLRNHMYRLF